MIPLAMFFDYLDLKGAKIRNCIPRLPAWDDKAISAFDNINFAQLKFKDISKTCFMQKPPCIPSSHSLPNEVAHFIDTLVPSDDDFRAKMKEMCTEFYKTSIDACLNALQPVLAKQMCTMVETIRNQVNNRASSSSTPPVTEQQQITGFHNPSVGLVLGMAESSDSDHICHGDLKDGDVVNGLLQLRCQGGSVMGSTRFGGLASDQVVAISNEHGPNKGSMTIDVSREAEHGMSLVRDTTLNGPEFVQHGEQIQLAAYAEEVADGQRCMSSPRGVDSTIQDSGMEDLSSAGTEAGLRKSTRISKRNIDLIVCNDFESGSSSPLKVQKIRSSAGGDKQKRQADSRS